MPTEAILHEIESIPEGFSKNTVKIPEPLFNKFSAVDAASIL
jgi:hypothetical protein